MHSSILATTIILTTILLILSSLGFGLFYLLRSSDGKRIATALTVRIILSMSLFLALVLAIYMGWIIPNPPAL